MSVAAASALTPTLTALGPTRDPRRRTGGEPGRTGADVFSLLWELAASRGTTVVVATHNPELAARATRRLHMRDGRVVESNGS